MSTKLKKVGDGRINSELVRDRGGERMQEFKRNLTDYQKTSKQMMDIATGKTKKPGQ